MNVSSISAQNFHVPANTHIQENKAVHDEKHEPKGVNDHDADDIGKSESVGKRVSVAADRPRQVHAKMGAKDKVAEPKAQVFDSRGQVHGGKSEPHAVDVLA